MITSFAIAEKLQIAKKYLLKKQREANGLKEENIEFSDRAILDISRHHLLRKARGRDFHVRVVVGLHHSHRRLAANRGDLTLKIADASLARIGMATGLAWMELGGELLAVEVTIVPGRSKLTITGRRVR